LIKQNILKNTYTYDSSFKKAQKEKVEELKKVINELIPAPQEAKGKNKFSLKNLNKNYKFMTHKAYV
jgi:hypothetical protein